MNMKSSADVEIKSLKHHINVLEQQVYLFKESHKKYTYQVEELKRKTIMGCMLYGSINAMCFISIILYVTF